MNVWDEIALEVARTEREAFDAVRRKIAARQLGEAFVNLSADDPSEDSLPQTDPAQRNPASEAA